MKAMASIFWTAGCLTQAQVQVSETVYRLEAEGTEFVVCQLESPLGIRMVDLHLPEAAE